MLKFLKKELQEFFSLLRDAELRGMGGGRVVCWEFDFFYSSVKFTCRMLPLPPLITECLKH